MTAAPILSVRDLNVHFGHEPSRLTAVRDVSLDVMPGEVLGLVGESGSGKSVTLRGLTRLLPATGTVTGQVHWQGRDLVSMSEGELRAVRGGQISMIFQEPMTALNPVLPVRLQIEENLRAHTTLDRSGRRRRARELLDLVGIPDAARRLDEYPHQFSGGMRQRVMIAIALASAPELLLADEPTTALDVTIQDQILNLILDLRDELGMSVVLVTHDLGVVAATCDRMAVMYAGRIVEQGRVRRRAGRAAPCLYLRPSGLGAARRDRAAASALDRRDAAGPRRDPAGLRLQPPVRVRHRGLPHGGAAARAPRAGPRCRLPPQRPRRCRRRTSRMNETRPILSAEAVWKRFVFSRTIGERLTGRPARAVHALNGVSLDVRRGETLGIVGESGCGKSTLARCLVRLHECDGGRVVFEGTDIATFESAGRRAFNRRVQMIFQDPYSSLNPRMTVQQILGEALRVHQMVPPERIRDRIAELLGLVRLPQDAAGKYPHEFSGGQRQRIGIARALAVEPEVLVADELVSALDVSVQAQVVNLLLELQERLHLTVVFVAHDLRLVRHISHRVAVMYLGKVAEIAPTEQLFEDPRHPYTQALLRAAPSLDPARRTRKVAASGELPSPIDLPSGCLFHTRCRHAFDRCTVEPPELTPRGPAHLAACHLENPDPEGPR